MTDVRRTASMSQVLADIKPYITKKFMAAPCIKEQDIQAICQILLPRYKNVKKSDLGWIDRLEEIDAALDDF